MFTTYKLWYIFMYLKHWVMSCPWNYMVRLDNVSVLVNESYCLGGPVLERSDLHRLRNVTSSKMLEGTQNLAD